MHLSKEAIGERLKIQRKQLGFVQEAFAVRLGISKRTLAGYEAGTSDIGASVLAKASGLGVDVLYVVSGQRTPSAADAISEAESALLADYRRLTESQRSHTSESIYAMAEMAGRLKVNGDK